MRVDQAGASAPGTAYEPANLDLETFPEHVKGALAEVAGAANERVLARSVAAGSG